MPVRPKVFGIGFPKTGTKSLAGALRTLGYGVAGPNRTPGPDIARQVRAVVDTALPKWDAFQDTPWPLVYREVDRRAPGSKFVLTVRPSGEWIRSVVATYGSRSSSMRAWVFGFGSPIGHEAAYVARYERHNADVVDYFAARPEDLLVLRITEGDGWERLAPFLGLPVPPGPFPHVNRRVDRLRPPPTHARP